MHTDSWERVGEAHKMDKSPLSGHDQHHAVLHDLVEV